MYGIRQMGGQRARARAARLSRSSQIERAVSLHKYPNSHAQADDRTFHTLSRSAAAVRGSETRRGRREAEEDTEKSKERTEEVNVNVTDNAPRLTAILLNHR